MSTYVVKRLLLMIPTVFGVSLVVWLVLKSAPEPPLEVSTASEQEGEEAKGEVSSAVKIFRAQYGLDLPAILNFYYSIDSDDVLAAIRVADGIGGEYDVKDRIAARERLIRWGYYAVPTLVALVAETEGRVRDAAANWFRQLAVRVPLVTGTGIVDPETARRNSLVTRENKILRKFVWKADDTDARKQAGVEAIKTWYTGNRERYAGTAVSEDDVRAAVEAGDRDRIAAWGAGAMPALVAIALEDDMIGPQASALLAVAGRGNGEAAETHSAVLGLLAWPENATPSQRAGARAVLRTWWDGAASRWDYSGMAKLRVLFLETQFARYWGNLFKFDLGVSTVHRRPVLDLIFARLKYSLSLAVPALILAFLIAVPLGLLSATLHGTWTEKGMALVVFALYSLPSFFVATLLIRFFAEGQPGSLEIIPPGGFEDAQSAWTLPTGARIRHILYHIAGPLFCMTYASFAALSRYAKTGLLNVIRSDYVRTARAKGLSEFRVIMKHAARNGIIPVITLLGTSLPVVVSGSFVVEFIFNIPGFGLLMVQSVKANDYSVIVGITLIVAILTMIGILLSDLLYAIADPRISFS